MRARVLWLSLLAVGLVRPLVAQGGDSERTEQLRHQVEGRFAERVREQLNLSDDQMNRLRGTARTYGARRRELAGREREIRAALAEQLRPGVAADQDSVSRLTDALVTIRDDQVHTLQDENREMAEYLTPVQRSQLFVMRERLIRRAREIREERGESGAVGRRWGGRADPGRGDDGNGRPRGRRARPERSRP
jgi:DNA anti-recombination protein RmuC